MSMTTMAGSLVGAVVGSIVAHKMKRVIQSRYNTPRSTVVFSTTDTDTPESPSVVFTTTTSPPSPPSPPPELPATKFEVLGVRTITLSQGSDLFVPLVRFHEFLRYAEELEALNKAINHLDRMCTMEASLHGAGAVPRNANMTAFAEAALRHAVRQLNEIVLYGDRVIPSQTRRTELLKLVDAIKEIGDAVVNEMSDLMAGNFST